MTEKKDRCSFVLSDGKRRKAFVEKENHHTVWVILPHKNGSKDVKLHKERNKVEML